MGLFRAYIQSTTGKWVSGPIMMTCMQVAIDRTMMWISTRICILIIKSNVYHSTSLCTEEGAR